MASPEVATDYSGVYQPINDRAPNGEHVTNEFSDAERVMPSPWNNVQFYYNDSGQLYYYPPENQPTQQPPRFVPNVIMTETAAPPDSQQQQQLRTFAPPTGTPPSPPRPDNPVTRQFTRDPWAQGTPAGNQVPPPPPPPPPPAAAAASGNSNNNNPGIATGSTAVWQMPFNRVPDPLRERYSCPVSLPPGKTKRAAGNFRVCCNCCFFTVDSWHTLVFAALVVGGSVIFMVGVVPHHEWYTCLVTCLLVLASLACLFLSVSIDPGIVPPAPLAEQPKERVQIVMVNHNRYPVECLVCPTCHIRRPPRSTHCQFTDVCVEEFDHYCPVLGACVAKRTFRFFGGFFIFTTLLIIAVLVRTIVLMTTLDYGAVTKSAWGRFRIAACVISLVAGVLFGLWVGIMGGQYIWLACINSTQKEVLRGRRNNTNVMNSPYDEGCCCNFFKRFFGPLGKSRIKSDYFV